MVFFVKGCGLAAFHKSESDSFRESHSERFQVFNTAFWKLGESSGITPETLLRCVSTDRVAAFILQTKDHWGCASEDPALRRFLDADLAILGATQPRYAEYARQVWLAAVLGGGQADRQEMVHFFDFMVFSSRITISTTHALAPGSVFLTTNIRVDICGNFGCCLV